MCGIAGIWYKEGCNKQLALKQLYAMTDAIKHRGPDGEGHQFFNQFLRPIAPASSNDESSSVIGCIGHRRLSIIDLSLNGAQPMTSKDDKVVISFNGEIFNYLELKSELKAKGHTFHTTSDTEVLIHCYLEWGENMYDRLEGMWAFVLLDKRSKTLLLSRDRTGVKPLYYRYQNGVFSFSSEIKALLSLQKESANNGAMSKLLVHNVFNFGNESLFQNIFELEGGTHLHFNTSTFDLNISSYHNIDVSDEDFLKVSGKELKEKSEQFYDLLEDSVIKHARADVPIGSCLSGGMDSGTIAGILNKNGFKNLQVFSSVFPGFENNEEAYISELVNMHQLNWTCSKPQSNQLISSLEDLVYTQEYPLLSTSTFAQYELMKSIAESDVKVLVNGQGADELLGGYNHYFHFLKKHLILKGNLKGAVDLPGKIKRTGVEFFKSTIRKNKSPLFQTKVYSKAFFDFECINGDWLKHSTVEPKTNDEPENLNRLLYQNYFDGPLTTLLRAEDRNSMRFSIESRVPFADSFDLMKSVFALGSRFKLGKNGNKLLLRSTAEQQGFLSSKIINRKDKLGYSTPSGKWLVEQQNELMEYLQYIPKEIIHHGKLENRLSRALRDSEHNAEENLRLFKWFTLGVWYKVFQES